MSGEAERPSTEDNGPDRDAAQQDSASGLASSHREIRTILDKSIAFLLLVVGVFLSLSMIHTMPLSVADLRGTRDDLFISRLLGTTNVPLRPPVTTNPNGPNALRGTGLNNYLLRTPGLEYRITFQGDLTRRRSLIIDWIDDSNYIEVRPWPEYAHWTITERVNGEPRQLADIVLGCKPFVAVVVVRSKDIVRLQVDGTQRAEVRTLHSSSARSDEAEVMAGFRGEDLDSAKFAVSEEAPP